MAGLCVSTECRPPPCSLGDAHAKSEFEPGCIVRLIDRIDTSPGEAGAAVPGGLARAWRELLGSTAARRRGDLIDPHRQGALNRRLLVLLVLARLVMAGTGIAALLIWGGGIAEFPLLRVSLVLLAMGGLSYFVQTALMRAAPPSESTTRSQRSSWSR